MTQVELLIQGNFLGLIKAELYLTAGYSLSSFGGNFYVRVTVDLGGLNKVRELEHDDKGKMFIEVTGVGQRTKI